MICFSTVLAWQIPSRSGGEEVMRRIHLPRPIGFSHEDLYIQTKFKSCILSGHMSCRECSEGCVDADYCLNCYATRVCNRCEFLNPEEDYGNFKFCEDCNRMISTDCGCVAVCWCQSLNGICHDCVSKYTFQCFKCDAILVPRVGELIVADNDPLCPKCDS